MIIPEIKEAMLTNFDTSEEIEIDIKKENLPKLMNIVTADLYKNKVGAVVRELSTNCLDAHKSINSTERFVIILPTDYNNNTLIIRDFGPGLSADQMKNIFGSLGESTKEKTNEFTGCLGIGSKSPLSITPQFNIISHYKNEVISYSCYQSGGLPKLNKFGQSLVGINE
jgi:HSP90 family molecular chaperone